MTIKLNEVMDMQNYMGNNLDDFISDLEETNGYMQTLEEITMDVKHIIASYLRSAIECNFNREVLSIDYGISSDIIDVLCQYKNAEIIM